MKVIVTCGPSYAPIDEVRRLTNFSTGQLGVLLANRLARAGHEVVCLKGVGASCEERLEGPGYAPFTTNDDLREQLSALSRRGAVGAVFHAAALCDFQVKSVEGRGCGDIREAKISSRAGELMVTLEPVAKLIAELRGLFPESRIVGWKYELNGTRDDALRRADWQINENRTNLCVVNGAAYGGGFGVYRKDAPTVHRESKEELCEWLVDWTDNLLA